MGIGFNRISYRNRYQRRHALDECAADDESAEGCWNDRDASMRENGSTACGRAVYVVRWCFGSEAAVRLLKEEGRISSKVEVASGSSRREVGLGRSGAWVGTCFVFQRPDAGEGGGQK